MLGEKIEKENDNYMHKDVQYSSIMTGEITVACRYWTNVSVHYNTFTQ